MKMRPNLTLSHMPWNCLQFEIDADGIATLTVNRPEKLNALNAQTISELGEAVAEIATNGSIRGVVLTGAGEKAFVAGADIGGIQFASPLAARHSSQIGQAVFRRLERLEKPVIAAINGFALGGGLELALSCTLRIASETARLGLPEVKLGIMPGYGGTQRLPRLVGRGRALEMILLGEPIDAAEAHRIGLVNRVTAPGNLLLVAKQILLRILANGPAAIGLALRAVDAGYNANLDEALELESAAFGVAAGTEDCREGVAAFLEKRKPVFTGN